MPQFTYQGFSQVGEAVSGSIEAVDRRGAVSELMRRGHFASDMLESVGRGSGDEGSGVFSLSKLRFSSSRIKSSDVLSVISQLSTAVRAGLPILNAIEIIASQQHKPHIRGMLDDMAHDVRSGKSLSEAMSRFPHAFSRLSVSMVRVGETGGILEKTLTQLTELLGREEKVKTSMKNAMAYPLFVLSIGLISVIIVITTILPKIIGTLTGGVEMLPLPTRMLMGMSDFLIRFGWLVGILLVLSVVWFKRWKQTAEGRLKWDSFVLKIPVLGSVFKTIAVGRFAHTLGALMKSGITILEALAVVRDTLANELLGRQIDEVSEKVRMGESIAEPLSVSGLFPPLLIQIVSMGEQTGKLDELLLNAADTFDEQADAAITRFMAIFPAVLILMLALVIGFIIAATLLPIVVMELQGAGF